MEETQLEQVLHLRRLQLNRVDYFGHVQSGDDGQKAPTFLLLLVFNLKAKVVLVMGLVATPQRTSDSRRNHCIATVWSVHLKSHLRLQMDYHSGSNT